ncbi:MAG: TIM barrel protein [Chloroherpetonaceae bacterium]|nr:TIM barrel protein [Chthonomonadaceae bacterium]MDW8206524.1 TIM barrel protein [Chloroherpetonaceae bacterium]
MNRRDFLQTGAATLATTAITATPSASTQAAQKPGKFRLKYAPHFGMFRHHAPGGPIDELKFAADQGFTAWEDNGMKGRSQEEQEKIAREMQRLGMTMGVFVANFGTAFGNPGLAQGKASEVERFLNEIRESTEVAKRVNARWVTVVPGERTPELKLDYQTANVIDALKRAAEICEKTGLIMVLEPLNHWRDHPNLFLADVAQGYMICRAVGSPSCKVLFDMYHEQIQSGNIIATIDRTWDEVAYFQIGDNPGRNEPTTGEMNYRNIFRHIHNKGYTGVLGMEHGISRGGKEGELALIKAYRECDSF